MIKFEEESRKKALLDVADRMMIAARTAPKGKGIDNIVAAVVGHEEIKKISDKMIELFRDHGAHDAFHRDAENIASSDVLVLIGTKIKPIGIPYCGLCGHKNCAEKDNYPKHPCAFNTGDLGIAVGSAVSIAMDSRVDNRLMFTAGLAARDLKILGDDVAIVYAIPLSCTSKNPFFDRVWPKKNDAGKINR